MYKESILKAQVNNRDVKLANQKFFNTVAKDYDKIDPRRSSGLLKNGQWIDDQLYKISLEGGSQSILDLGCGSGLIIEKSKNLFVQVFGIDISLEILKNVNRNNLVCGDISNMPFKPESFNAVICFATLHHCLEHFPIIKESHRILKKGGIFYSDHDLGIGFARKFYIFLCLYRRLFGSEKRYLQNSCIDKRTYELSEYYSDGISHKNLKKYLVDCNFKNIIIKSHFRGQSSLTDWLTHKINVPPGLAPVIFSLSKKF